MSPSAEITRLGATDLDAEVPGHAQKILRSRYLGARTRGAELGGTDLGAERATGALTARATRRTRLAPAELMRACCSLLLLPPVRCWSAEVAEARGAAPGEHGADESARQERACVPRGPGRSSGSAGPSGGSLAGGEPLGRPRYSPTNCGLPVQRSAGPLYSIARGWTGHAVKLPWTRSMLLAGVAFPWPPGWADESARPPSMAFPGFGFSETRSFASRRRRSISVVLKKANASI